MSCLRSSIMSNRLCTSYSLSLLMLQVSVIFAAGVVLCTISDREGCWTGTWSSSIICTLKLHVLSFILSFKFGLLIRVEELTQWFILSSGLKLVISGESTLIAKQLFKESCPGLVRKSVLSSFNWENPRSANTVWFITCTASNKHICWGIAIFLTYCTYHSIIGILQPWPTLLPFRLVRTSPFICIIISKISSFFLGRFALLWRLNTF